MNPKNADASVKRIGILGGCFDPPHLGHLAIAALAREHFNLERFFLIPSGTPPHKSGTTGADHRLAMLRAMMDAHPQFDVWDGELHREGPSYTIDTLASFQARFPAASIYFVIGADNLSEIRTWRNWQDILAIVTLCVAERPGYPIQPPPELCNARIETFPSPQWGVSSSLIRKYRAQGLSCDGMLDKSVQTYCTEKKLYTEEI